MKKVVLISCVSQKLGRPAKARDLYTSTLFRSCLAFAESMNPDQIFILSAKYGLVEAEKVIEPYEETLNTKGVVDIKIWADRVFDRLQVTMNISDDEFIFLAGERYRRYLVPRLRHTKVPLEGLTIGRQLQFLKHVCANE
jgi:cytoplasmic iron level regulating protein YaaA (DUF328/UPF0246 family)